MKKRFTVRSIILTAALSVLVTLGAAALTAWLLLGSSGLAITAGAALLNTRFVGEYDPRCSCAGTTSMWGSA